MSKRKFTIIYFFSCLVVMCFLGVSCDNIPDDIDEKGGIDSNKTYLEITNNSQFTINIYFNSSLKNAWSKVLAGETITKEINLDEIKNRIYIEYEYKINSVIIPFFDSSNIGCVKTIPIRENQINALEISKLTSLSFDTKTYLIVQNKTTDYIYVEEQTFNKINEIYQNASDEYWINPQSNAVYNISNINLKDCYIINGNSNLNLNLGKLKSGRVYSVCYDGNEIFVFSIDLGINPRNKNGLPIYTISSASDLTKLSKYNDVNTTFELTQNIDAKNSVWNPINTFKGTLIGNGFSISNLKINMTFSLDNQTACSGFILENKGTIKNIFFKGITVYSNWVESTSEWRYLNVGTIAGINSGKIENVHLENINLSSKLNHSEDESHDEVRQLNRTGGIIGQNKGTINCCSIRNSSIVASTDAKNNWCDAYTYVGGICGKNTKECANLLSITVNINANLRGGFNWWTGGDGHFKAYLGNILGGITETGNNSKLISYNNTTPKVTIDNLGCDNTTSELLCENIFGINKGMLNEVYSIKDFTDLNSKSEIINSWENWSIHGDAPENYTDFLY